MPDAKKVEWGSGEDEARSYHEVAPIRPNIAWKPMLVVRGHAYISIKQIFEIVVRQVQKMDDFEKAANICELVFLEKHSGEQLRISLNDLRFALQGWKTPTAPLAGGIKLLIETILEETRMPSGATQHSEAKFNMDELNLDLMISFDPTDVAFKASIEH